MDAPTYYEYGQGNNTTGRPDWLQVVKRGNATDGSGKLQLARFVYGVNPAGNGMDLPNLSAAQVKLWDQDQAPVIGYAVFGTGKDVNTSKASGVSAGDWKYADLQFVDAKNRVVNTASYAAGSWQTDANVLDEDGVLTRSYDERGIRMILDAAKDPTNLTDGVVNGHTDQASLTYFWSDLADFLDADGNGKSSKTDAAEKSAEIAKNEATAAFLRGYATDTFSPVTSDENGAPARVHTRTTYTPVSEVDAGGSPRIFTTKVVSTKSNSGDVDLSIADEPVLSEVHNSYDAFETTDDGKSVTDKSNLRSGWIVGSPTKVTQ